MRPRIRDPKKNIYWWLSTWFRLFVAVPQFNTCVKHLYITLFNCKEYVVQQCVSLKMALPPPRATYRQTRFDLVMLTAAWLFLKHTGYTDIYQRTPVPPASILYLFPVFQNDSSDQRLLWKQDIPKLFVHS